MSHRGGGSEKGQKSLTYYLNGPLPVLGRKKSFIFDFVSNPSYVLILLQGNPSKTFIYIFNTSPINQRGKKWKRNR